MTSLELLAPARNADIGIAAIRCGADAVYIGGPGFGARAAAGNSIEDIERLCSYAARFGVRIFVTVNTLADNEQEKAEIVDMMLSMKDKSISAFILQDTSLLPLLSPHGPWKEEFHASTQCAVRTPQRALELASMGFSRLILERELSLDQIKEIRSAVPAEVELECFVHGALCVCYSGDCYLSEHLAGRSANRGECAQPCRNTYDLVDRDGKTLVAGKPLLSLKDLKLIGRIPQLAETGIVSFKIEGRLKNESYVKNVTRAYSDALDAFVNAHSDKYRRASFGRVHGGFTPNLDKTFNRAYTSLFIDGKRVNWNSGDFAKGMGERLGKVSAATKHGPSMTVELNMPQGKSVNNGDGLCFVAQDGEVVGFRADKAEGRRIFCKYIASLRPGSEIWRNRDIAFERELENRTPERLIDVSLHLEFAEGSLFIKATAEDGRTVEKTFPVTDAPVAENQDRMTGLVKAQMGKTAGDYSFTVEDISAQGALPLLSSSLLNSYRREIAEALDTMAVEKPCPAHCPTINGSCAPHPRREGELMRSRYCILDELGLCLQTGKGRAFAKNGLLLRNNGKLIPLSFDCHSCEMVLKEPGENQRRA